MSKEGDHHPSYQPENATAVQDLLGKLMYDIAEYFPGAVYMEDTAYYRMYDAFEKHIRYTINMVVRERKLKK